MTMHGYTDPALDEAHAFGFREGYQAAIEAEAQAAPDALLRKRELVHRLIDSEHCDCCAENLGVFDAALAALTAAPPASAERDVIDDLAADMCPNCVTPWKCNGPHLNDETPRRRRAAEAR
jgi:hypothetical protein